MPYRWAQFTFLWKKQSTTKEILIDKRLVVLEWRAIVLEIKIKRERIPNAK
jgi:hypothetical protein